MYRANRPQTAELLGILLAPFECRDGITLAVVGSMNISRTPYLMSGVTANGSGMLLTIWAYSRSEAEAEARIRAYAMALATWSLR